MTARTTMADSGMGQAGARLREIRQEKGMSLVDVSTKAGVTKGFLSLAERGRTNVSVPVLMRICRALDISPAVLFEYPPASVVHKDSAAASEMGGFGVTDSLLTPDTEEHIQVIHTKLEPHGGSGGGYQLDATSICVYILKGALSIAVDGAETRLDVGDCLTFGARQTHDWHNPTDSDAEVLWMITPPIPREHFRFALSGGE